MEPIRVMMLGPTQSGKTLFLSAMWQKLQWPLDPGFHLEVVTPNGIPDAATRNRLDTIFNHLISRDDFPPGTSLGSKTNYRFQCLLQNASRSYVACDIEYLDYAGGLLTGESVKDSDFDGAVGKADVLLGLIDGVRVILAMENDDNAREWVERELEPTLVRIATTIRNNPNRPVSVHFVISKWDAVRQLAPERTLEDFREFLLAFPAVQSLLDMTPRGATVRLIPVSALGESFAYVKKESVDAVDGQRTQTVTRKRAVENRVLMPIPINIEMPLACALPDVLTQRIAGLIQERENAASRLEDLKVSAPKTFFQRLQAIKVPFLREIGALLSRTPQQRQKDAAVNLLQRHKSINDSETAFQYMFEFCTALRDSFEQEAPASVLKRGIL